MASSLEGNKLLASILTGGIIVFGAGVISQVVYGPDQLEENAFPVAIETGGGEGGADEEAVPIAVLLASADVAAGEKVGKKCTACHDFAEGGANKIGPILWGVVNREIGGVDGFAYSDELANMDAVWDYAALDGFLHDPKGWAPGTKMAFAGLGKPNDRADMIIYLRSLAADPAPLPEAGAEEAAAEDVAAADAAAEGEAAETAEAIEDVVEEGGSEATDADVAAADAAEAEADAAPAGDAAGGGIASLVAAADPEAGSKVARKCKACHSFDEGGANKVGPPLWDIVNRDIGVADGFGYSDVIAEHGGQWDYESLDGYIANPKEWAPGNKMSFAGIKKEEDRAALIAYLRTLSGDPAPLP